jgi:hypothetical protein
MDDVSVTECEAAVEGPGKFEGERPWVYYYWALAMEGGADEEYEDRLIFDVKPEDVALFEELSVYSRVVIRETGDGFVRGYGWIPAERITEE